MGIQGLYTAATGMDAMQSKLDVIANNLANVNTTGFKKDQANFEDLYYHHRMLPGQEDASGQRTGVGIQVGLGTKVSSTQTQFSQGAFRQTDGPLDVAITGAGFLQVLDASGEIMYTRAGNLTTDADGNVVVGSSYNGRLLNPPLTLPVDAMDISISSNGQINYKQPGNPETQTVGPIQMAQFPNPAGLLKVGENLYTESSASGSPQTANPGENGTGNLLGGYLELSNVEPVEELIDLITTQRAFELNSQCVQAGDQMLQLISNLRRG